jgi:hypothetical protein
LITKVALRLVLCSASFAALIAPSVGAADDLGVEAKIYEQLSRPTRVDFNLVPPNDLAAYLGDFHGIPIVWDIKTFEKIGFEYKRLTFTRKLDGVPLGQVLADLLGRHKLSFMIKDHKLTLTTAEEASDWQLEYLRKK